MGEQAGRSTTRRGSDAPCGLGLTDTESALRGRQAGCSLPPGGLWLPATSPALRVLMRQQGLGCSERQNRGGGDGADDQQQPRAMSCPPKAPWQPSKDREPFGVGGGRLRH